MHPELQKLVSAAKLSPSDAAKIDALQPGAVCQHKSWGLGKIAEWDLLGDRVIIDFETKAGHPMKLSFAAESLVPLPAEHILAMRVADPDSLKAMSRDKLVELALKSSGNTLSIDDLEKLLTPKIVSSSDFKKWWEAAKKDLKSCRHIVVPARRSDPITMRTLDEKPGAIMVKDLLGARDLKGKLNALAAVMKDLDLFENAADELSQVFSDISETVKKSWRLNLKDSLQLLLHRDELAEAAKATLAGDSLGVHDIVREARPQISEVVNSLSVSSLGRLYRSFPKAFPDGAWIKEALAHLTRTGGRAVSEITAVLDENDQLDVLAEFLRKAVRNRTLSTDLLIWICKERKGLAASVFDMDLGNAILGALEDDHVAGGPKRTGRLSDAFAEDRTLLGEMVADADDEELRLLARRILATPVFDELTKRSLMGKIIKARPEMERLMEENEAARKDEALIVSWESLEAKKKELDDIINVKIPQNKRDIQIAREYGDLRENFEYKSAKQQQAVLLRLQNKYERELRHAQGTDFTGVAGDRVAVGTIVTIQDLPDGPSETFTILGAWDSEPEKGIVSYLSESARALIGKTTGDEAELPADTTQGSRKVKILSVRAFKS
ncbi:MAG: GreA/GreB family elongation factor [Verrucomicrobiaceae bacterium]|nr:GreA/GreB family elongation factor [Verrucomicrobiaceae bacterium]